MIEPQVSVVIPAWRAASTIERAVRSALAQPGVAVEVIVVVDDGSAATQAIVDAVDGPVRSLVNDRNRGAPYSRNRGLAEARGRAVMFLDADDYVAGDLFAPLLAAFDADGAQIGLGPWLRLDEDADAVTRHVADAASPARLFERWVTAKRWTPPCAVLWDAHFLRGIGGWDEDVRRNQDGELVLRALLLGARPCATTTGAGVYVQHPSDDRISLSRTNFDALLHVADKLAAIPSDVVPQAARRRMLGAYLYDVARVHFWHGEWELGRAALARARTFGYRGHQGGLLSRLSYRALGLERQQRWRQALRRR